MGTQVICMLYFAYRITARPPFRRLRVLLEEATADSKGRQVGLGEATKARKGLYHTALECQAKAAADRSSA
jgi:hypothetical protein